MDLYCRTVLTHSFRAMTRELPQNFPYAIKVFYIKQSTSEWAAPMDRLFKRAETMFDKEVKKLVQRHFSRFNAGSFNSEMMYVSPSLYLRVLTSFT